MNSPNFLQRIEEIHGNTPPNVEPSLWLIAEGPLGVSLDLTVEEHRINTDLATEGNRGRLQGMTATFHVDSPAGTPDGPDCTETDANDPIYEELKLLGEFVELRQVSEGVTETDERLRRPARRKAIAGIVSTMLATATALTFMVAAQQEREPGHSYSMEDIVTDAAEITVIPAAGSGLAGMLAGGVTSGLKLTDRYVRRQASKEIARQQKNSAT